MVTLAAVEEQLKAIGCNFRFWGRSEVKELTQILLPGEQIAMCVNGQYEAGFALLCATDFRVLLVDKKPKYLSLKDIRFDMITELDYNSRWLDSTVHIYTPNKELKFTTTNSNRLRKLFSHTQQKVMEIRHHSMIQQYQIAHDLQNVTPGIAISNMYQQLTPMANTPDRAVYTAQSDSAASEIHNRMATAMGAAGLRSIVHNGKVVKEYMSVPFTQRWKKRPYGFSRDPMA